VGLEIDPFEVEYGRRRLARAFPDRDASQLLCSGDGRALPFADASFQVVTLWNVLEHVPQIEDLIGEVSRVLRRDGAVYIVCPNYAADRLEAHYHIPMEGLVPRDEMVRRLTAEGRDPSFFETSIHYRTNTEVISALGSAGFAIYDMQNRRRMDRCLRTLWSRCRAPQDFDAFHDPRRESVMLAARKQR
ncbi:MAG: class I SAM-dependent methyltransferase, partial [Magnetococcales bacterium]|nr:class I SAM-dependent methyltransferase [Magnetococcales bacterium]